MDPAHIGIYPCRSAMQRARARACLSKLSEVLERDRPELEAKLFEIARMVPAFAKLIDELDPCEIEARSRESRKFERRALVEGDWEPTLSDLRRRGAMYADMGIPFAGWFIILRPHREVVTQRAFMRDDRT